MGLPLRQAGGRRQPLARRAGGVDGGHPLGAAPEEEFRAAAKEPAKAAGFKAPAGILAHAVSYSGGSLAPAGLPEVPPNPALTAQCVAGAIKLAAATAPPDQAKRIFHRFLALGIGIAIGKHAEKLSPAN